MNGRLPFAQRLLLFHTKYREKNTPTANKGIINVSPPVSGAFAEADQVVSTTSRAFNFSSRAQTAARHKRKSACATRSWRAQAAATPCEAAALDTLVACESPPNCLPELLPPTGRAHLLPSLTPTSSPEDLGN